MLRMKEVITSEDVLAQSLKKKSSTIQQRLVSSVLVMWDSP